MLARRLGSQKNLSLRLGLPHLGTCRGRSRKAEKNYKEQLMYRIHILLFKRKATWCATERCAWRRICPAGVLATVLPLAGCRIPEGPENALAFLFPSHTQREIYQRAATAALGVERRGVCAPFACGLRTASACFASAIVTAPSATASNICCQ